MVEMTLQPSAQGPQMPLDGSMTLLSLHLPRVYQGQPLAGRTASSPPKPTYLCHPPIYHVRTEGMLWVFLGSPSYNHTELSVLAPSFAV